MKAEIKAKEEKVARAIARHVRIAPRKLRLVADLVRGKQALHALAILRFTPKRGAKIVEKTIRSAMANAENNHEMDVEKLYVKEIYVDEGPRLKRWRARAMGRAARIIKRTSHLTVVLAEREGKPWGKR
ncbi:MAG: LSU ribosomal protein L22p (L17e) [Brockia lithotrophica]|uniref:Large ribosomal subunit protein uL22 n=1 Tax=Brockia lithotrophica TaxID=933949 RepID=A0A2T5G4Y1_9BACL|nr:MAG: LSU ribosomal protein L22p (L17e) [Brockia lithotrophica]